MSCFFLLLLLLHRGAFSQLLLDENVLSFPISVREAHARECAPLRDQWIFCDNFETERPDAYIERPHPVQQRVLGEPTRHGRKKKTVFFACSAFATSTHICSQGTGVMLSYALMTEFLPKPQQPKAILKFGFSKVPNERFNPLALAPDQIYDEVHVRFYLKLTPRWHARPQTIVSIGSIISPAWQEGMRSSVMVDERVRGWQQAATTSN